MTAPRRLLAVIYAFEVFRDGERRLVSEEQLPASTYEYLLQQLEAVPKRTLVDAGPGLLVYDNYQDARYAATTVAKVASRVALREVAAEAATGPVESQSDGESWVAASGRRYAAVPDGVAETIKQ